MCDTDAYYKDHLSMPTDASSGSGRPMLSKPYKLEPLLLGQKINFIDNWIQCFEVNHESRTTFYKI